MPETLPIVEVNQLKGLQDGTDEACARSPDAWWESAKSILVMKFATPMLGRRLMGIHTNFGNLPLGAIGRFV